jgi:hypothetical protein
MGRFAACGAGYRVKDVSAAVEKYGKLFVLKAILQGKQSSRLKIELMKKRIHNWLWQQKNTVPTYKNYF